MIFPSTHTPADNTWGAVITIADGYISIEDAAIDYSESESNAGAGAGGKRTPRQQGFPAARLVGWASPPDDDKATNNWIWAKDTTSGQHMLNYFVRALGRHGVIRLNFVADIDQLPRIQGAISAVCNARIRPKDPDIGISHLRRTRLL